MLASRRVLTSSAIFVASAAFCFAQNIAPAHSGTVHYFEGDVTVDGVKLVSQVARFAELKEQSVLQTGMGRAEILLTPGVLLRLGENSSVKMLDNRLMSTRVEFLSGSAMMETVDAGSSIKDPAVTIIYKNFEAQSAHSGIFEILSQPSELRVFKGDARVTGNGTTVTVKDGNMVDLGATVTAAKFDAKDGDDLYLWSRDRSAYLAAGNMASARTLASSGPGGSTACAGGMGMANGMGYISPVGYGYGNAMGYGMGTPYAGWNPAMWNGFSGGWYYNQCMNMYSYLPFSGTVYGPFGYGYFNPVTIGYAYNPGGYYWTGAGGAKTGTTTGLSLPTLAPTGTTARPALPRLGTTATANPTLSTALRATQGGTSGAATFRAVNTGNGNQNSFQSGGISSPSAARTATIAAPATMAAPAMSAAPRAAASARR